MCGFAGFLVSDGNQFRPRDVLVDRATAMSERITHRGPDDAGIWIDESVQIALAFRRLAIVDLTPAGHQPMESKSGRFVITFNGEIYNFRELRADLEGSGNSAAFRGHSDTEVLLTAIEQWGVCEALRKCVGMFALAVWDRKQHCLHLARDRFGEKPLYYGCSGGTLLFGSELKSLRTHPAFVNEIDRDSLALFMRHGYIPAPRSIHRGIKKLVPGEILTVRPDDVATGDLPTAAPYWSVRDAYEHARANPFRGSSEDAVGEVDGVLRRTIRQQMVADVPVGAFLSGGIDSSLVVALMQSESTRPVKTFSIGFHEAAFNEAHHAKDVARHLGTDHTELYVSPQECREVIPRLPEIYDEPFADSSQIPTCLVSELARRHVTVSLSGDGGDEMFGGYTRYHYLQRFWNSVSWLPSRARKGAGRLVAGIPAFRSPKSGSIGRKIYWAGRVLAVDSFEQAYRTAVSIWRDTAETVINSQDDLGAFAPDKVFNRGSLLRRMMLIDAVSYLPDDILVKVDRATMSVSLESRAPLLDHRLAEFTLRLPDSLLLREGRSKWLMRQILDRYVPQSLIDRPKMGFGVPVGAWLTGPLRGWAENLLDEQRLQRGGYLNHRVVRAAWTEHLSGTRDYSSQIWNVLMFQAWLEQVAAEAGAFNRAA